MQIETERARVTYGLSSEEEVRTRKEGETVGGTHTLSSRVGQDTERNEKTKGTHTLSNTE
jgi:hypothetical protein